MDERENTEVEWVNGHRTASPSILTPKIYRRFEPDFVESLMRLGKSSFRLEDRDVCSKNTLVRYQSQVLDTFCDAKDNMEREIDDKEDSTIIATS